MLRVVAALPLGFPRSFHVFLPSSKNAMKSSSHFWVFVQKRAPKSCRNRLKTTAEGLCLPGAFPCRVWLTEVPPETPKTSLSCKEMKGFPYFPFPSFSRFRQPGPTKMREKRHPKTFQDEARVFLKKRYLKKTKLHPKRVPKWEPKSLKSPSRCRPRPPTGTP